MLNKWVKQLRANSYVIPCILMGVAGRAVQFYITPA